MKLLLTSGGITNESIKNAFLGLAGKPAEEIKVAFIPTAGLPEPGDKAWLINDLYRLKQLGCYVDIVDLAQLKKEEWLARAKVCDVIFVGGGNSFYLSYWFEQSGFFAMLPELLKTRVYTGISAGSMIVTGSLKLSSQALNVYGQLKNEEEYNKLGPEGRSLPKTANLVPFLFRPHLNSESFPMSRLEFMAEAAKDFAQPIYVADDQTAIKVVNDTIEVVSEGTWKKYN